MSCAVPDRALDPAQRVAAPQVLQPRVRDEQLVGGRREPLAQRGGLRGDVVAAPGHHQLGVLGRAAGQPGEQRDGPVADVLQRQPDLQLLDVLGEVAAGHPLVHVLVPGQRAELLDARLDVVAGDPLAGRDGGEVDLLDDALVVRDRLRRGRRRPGRAGRAAPRSTAGAPARSCSPATTARRARGSRSARPGRWGSRAPTPTWSSSASNAARAAARGSGSASIRLFTTVPSTTATSRCSAADVELVPGRGRGSRRAGRRTRARVARISGARYGRRPAPTSRS